MKAAWYNEPTVRSEFPGDPDEYDWWMDPCPTCHGSREVPYNLEAHAHLPRREFALYNPLSLWCPTCGGTGKIED